MVAAIPWFLGARAPVTKASLGLTIGNIVVITGISGSSSLSFDVEETADDAGADAISTYTLLVNNGATAASHPAEAAAASAASIHSVVNQSRSSLQGLCTWRSFGVQPQNSNSANLSGPTTHVGKSLPTCPVIEGGSLIIARNVRIRQSQAAGMYTVEYTDASGATISSEVSQAVVDGSVGTPAPIINPWSIDIQGSPILHLVKRFPLSSSCPPNEAAGSDLLAVLCGCKQIISHLANDQTSNNIITSMLNTLVQNAMNGRYTATALDFSSGTWPSDPTAFGEAIIGAQPSAPVPAPRQQIAHPRSDALEKAAGSAANFKKVCSEAIDSFEERQPKQQRLLNNDYYMAGCIERTFERWGVSASDINIKFASAPTSTDQIVSWIDDLEFNFKNGITKSSSNGSAGASSSKSYGPSAHSFTNDDGGDHSSLALAQRLR